MGGLRAELDYVRKHCPSERGGRLDADGKHIPGSSSAYSFVGGGKPKGDDERTFIASDDLVLTRVNGVVSFPPEDNAGAAARKMAAHPNLLRAVESIYGNDFIPYGDSYVLKPPQDGAGWDWHQVLCLSCIQVVYLPSFPSQDSGIKSSFPYPWQAERGINMGLYLHDSTVSNGCLHVVPGSHKEKATPEQLTPKDGRGNIIDGAVAVECRAGTVAVAVECRAGTVAVAVDCRAGTVAVAVAVDCRAGTVAVAVDCRAGTVAVAVECRAGTVAVAVDCRAGTVAVAVDCRAGTVVTPACGFLFYT
jgi:hypothetical protein